MQLLSKEEKKSVYKSAGISLAAALSALAIISALQYLLPEQDFSATIAIILTAISGFLANFVQKVLKF